MIFTSFRKHSVLLFHNSFFILSARLSAAGYDDHQVITFGTPPVIYMGQDKTSVLEKHLQKHALSIVHDNDLVARLSNHALENLFGGNWVRDSFLDIARYDLASFSNVYHPPFFQIGERAPVAVIPGQVLHLKVTPSLGDLQCNLNMPQPFTRFKLLRLFKQG